MSRNQSSGGNFFDSFVNGDAGPAPGLEGITTKAFALNLALGIALFVTELTGFFLLKSSKIGRRIFQPKTYLVQERLRVETIPVNPLKWIYRIFTIKGEELKLKCGLDGYFFIRFIRAMIVIFVPLMVVIVPILLPVNYNGGKNNNVFLVQGRNTTYNVRGLDTLSWQNVAPTQTDRNWAHMVCALLAIGWTLYRIYREKLHFIQVRHEFLTSPEHRLKASARTILVTNIPSEYRSNEALEALFDVFVDNDDRSKLMVWVNRDYKSLRALILRRQKLCSALEKEEIRMLRKINKKHRNIEDTVTDVKHSGEASPNSPTTDEGTDADTKHARQQISISFQAECRDDSQLWRKYLKESHEAQITIAEDGAGGWVPVSRFGFKSYNNKKKVPKTAWLRAEIARLNVQIEEILPNLDDETCFRRQNSAFIQFDRQMSAHMAYGLTTHHRPGCMAPRFLDVAPHEILWPNMGLTSRARFIRTCIALGLFVGIIILWGIPATALGVLSQLGSVRSSYSWLSWLETWPSWIISFISGPLVAILLALLVQLVVPALCRKLAVLVGTPTRSKREVVTQSFYFTFLFIELVLVTSISSGIVATATAFVENPASIPNTLATDLPKAANYFFNYLIIQALAFSGSVLVQYLRLLYISLIWPFFTQTPRQEAWLQTTIPHQMWANMYGMFTNFAVIALIYSITAPLMLIIISCNFSLFWIAYRHNYYYVQRNKIDTHGMLFENALSQLFAGVYVLEATLIGLFFLARDSDGNLACTPQAIIMIVALALTAVFHYVLETTLQPLYELLPATREDMAVAAERERSPGSSDSTRSNEQQEIRQSDSIELSDPSSDLGKPETPDKTVTRLDTQVDGTMSRMQTKGIANTAANARRAMLRLNRETAARQASNQAHRQPSMGTSRRREVADQMGAAIAGYPDDLADLSPEELEAELKAAYQDPVTREPPPVVWIPQDPAGVSEDTVKRAAKYGRYLQYSNSGAFLTKKNKVEVTQPAPDARPDWLLDWVL